MQDVLLEIIEWSKERPAWQRDALRRLFTLREITPADLEELLQLCKAAHGLGDHRVPAMLSDEHLAIKANGDEPVSLVSVTHHRGVNALAPEQTIAFGRNLTIVYGPNAAGKSGYTRILKRACRSRSAEEILGNVLDGETPLKPQATIRFRKGADETPLSWTPEGPASGAVSAISVFDAHCAPVYLRDKTDVAFRPFSLDIFDKLSAICGEIRKRLEAENTVLIATSPSLPNFPEGTRVRSVIDNLTSLTPIDEIRTLATLSKDEKRRLKELKDQQRDLLVADPKQRARELGLKADRTELLIQHVTGLVETLGDVGLGTLRAAADTLRITRRALTVLRKTTLTPDLLPGSGEDAWRKMWDAAAGFSAVAYPGLVFPVLSRGARCPFCQQPIGSDTAGRLKHFTEYVMSNAQADVRKAEKKYREMLGRVTEVVIGRTDINLAINEVGADDPDLAQRVRTFLQSAAHSQNQIKEAMTAGKELPAHGLEPGPDTDLHAQAKILRDRAAQLQTQARTMDPKTATELKEFEARASLNEHLNSVLNEIERKKRIAAYRQCLDDTSTQPITRKSTELTKRLITDQLREGFQAELSKLEFKHLAVEIRAAGGAKGALFHRLVFTNAPGVAVTDVLSEGESRTLSLAAFLTELSTAASRSAIIFDDPVSSLDHIWRERIARRLVTEATKRQVIVFTHDILFLRLLLDECSRQDVPHHHQYVRRDGQAGLSSPDLPWIAMTTRDRIGTLRNRWQATEKLSRTSSPEAYEKEAREIYGLLREAWEQAITEVLLNDVVERYRNSIETQKVKCLYDITQEDCRMVESAMSECSRWMRGHDHPAADATPFPQPTDLQKRIDDLDNWVQTIRRRRK